MEKHDLLISIIVPVYNVEKYLDKCILSLIEQTYRKLEIILVDDGATDKSGSICDRYAERDTRIIVIHQHNKGLSAAREVGVKRASGEYLMFVDGDDWVDTCICFELLSAIQNYHVQSAMCGYVREYPDRSLPKTVYAENTILNGKTILRRLCGPVGTELASPDKMESLNSAWAKLYPAEVVKKIEMVSVTLIGPSEDLMLNLEAYSMISSAVYLNMAFYHYRKDNENATTMQYKHDLTLKWRELYCRIERIIRERQLGDTYYDALKNRIALNTLGAGLNCVIDDASILEKRKRLCALVQDEQRHAALEQLSLHEMPIHWKVFYFCAKNQWVLPMLCLLQTIKILKRKI